MPENKKYQGVFHLTILLGIPIIVISIFVLESWIIPLVYISIVAVIFALLRRK